MDKIIHLPEVDSTNEFLKRNLTRYADGTLVWADKQTKGKGSNGRAFLSPVGGIYMSFLFDEPDGSLLPLITPLAAVAVRRAILAVFHSATTVKWVNDLFFNGKKVCGILCETTLSHLIVGIGVNLSPPEGGFPPELSDIAGTVCRTYPPLTVRETFAKRCYDEFLSMLLPENRGLGMAEYANSSCVLHRTVSVTRGDETVRGVAEKIDADGSLVLRTSSGKTVLRSGTLTFL